MDTISQLLHQQHIKKRHKAPNKNIHSEVHYWADIISSHFGEKKKFGMYLGVIKRIGIDHAKQIFDEVKNSNVDNPGRLFVWKSKRVEPGEKPR